MSAAPRGAAVNPNPNRTLLVLAAGGLAYALAQTMIVPALPEIQRTFGGDPADATWLLTAFLLTAAVATPLFGRLGDMYGKEHWLLISLGVFGAGLGRVGARRLARRDDRRARDPGRGRRDLPARDRDHPRRVPAREGRDRHRDDLGDVRHRRRRRARRRRRPRRRRSASRGSSGSAPPRRRSPRGRRGSTSPSRPCASRRGSTGSAACCSRPRSATLLLGVSEGNAWGWGSAGVLGLFAASAVLTVVWACVGVAGRRPARGPAAHAPASGVDDERHRLRDRLRDVRLLRAHPAARADAGARRLRVRRVGDGERAVPAAVGARDAVRRPGERAARDAVRLEAAARARGGVRRRRLLLARRGCTTRASTSTSAACCSASGSASRSRRWPI